MDQVDDEMDFEDAGGRPVVSPCTGLCTIGPRDVCIGCRRTLAEIAAWSGMTDGERRAVLARLDRDASA